MSTLYQTANKIRAKLIRISTTSKTPVDLVFDRMVYEANSSNPVSNAALEKVRKYTMSSMYIRVYLTIYLLFIFY